MFTDLFVDGDWIPGGGRRSVMDPATGEVIAEVATADWEHCELAISAADRAAAGWWGLPGRERAEILRRAFELMLSRREEIAELISRENGKSRADARAEVNYAAEFFRWFSEEAVRVTGDFRAAPAGDKQLVVTQEPVGVSLLITPWNYPAAMATRKIAPALAAGCTVVLKPAGETPLTALLLADLLTTAGVPAGVVNVVLPEPVGELVDRMMHDTRVRNLSFTGSTEVGRVLLRAAADTVMRTSMELGGNAPFLVLDDADIDLAVEGALIAKLRNGGAACTAANRFYVAAERAEEFTELLAKRMCELRVGAWDTEAEIGSLVSVAERDKVRDLVESALAEGAVSVAAAEVPAGPGAFYPPTVLKVSAESPLLSQEIFGPVAPIVAVRDDDEAVARANDSEYGLIAYVFSSDTKRAVSVARRLEAGMVAINRGVLSDPAAPFGGVKQSGIGREGGFHGIHEFLETKFIALDL